jgi:DNA-binding NtrC family response regulator
MDTKIFKPIVLAVDDEVSVLESFKLFLEDKYHLLTATNGKDAMETIKKKWVNLVLLDIRLPEMDGMEILRKIKEFDSNIEVIMITAVKTIETAVEAMKLGAHDYISKPFNVEEMMVTIKKAIEKQTLIKEVEYLRSELNERIDFESMVGTSEKMQRVFETIKDVAMHDATVLILGESGTGKEMVARAIHYNSKRKDKPFIAVDCAALTPTLIESELFGHEKGSFTDATKEKTGKFELAHGGTLFLDEIGNLGLDTQVKILRTLQEREIEKVGGERTIKVDLRLISATNVDLKKALKDGKFREDLYYRLNVVPVEIPPLRERSEDIPLLANHFLAKYNQEFNKKIKGFSYDTMKYFTQYKWPGNVRELQNIIERLVVLGKEDVISPESLPLDIIMGGMENKTDFVREDATLLNAVDEFQKQRIINALEKVKWNSKKAAQILGIHYNTIRKNIKRLNITPPGSVKME